MATDCGFGIHPAILNKSLDEILSRDIPVLETIKEGDLLGWSRVHCTAQRYRGILGQNAIRGFYEIRGNTVYGYQSSIHAIKWADRFVEVIIAKKTAVEQNSATLIDFAKTTAEQNVETFNEADFKVSLEIAKEAFEKVKETYKKLSDNNNKLQIILNFEKALKTLEFGLRILGFSQSCDHVEDEITENSLSSASSSDRSSSREGSSVESDSDPEMTSALSSSSSARGSSEPSSRNDLEEEPLGPSPDGVSEDSNAAVAFERYPIATFLAQNLQAKRNLDESSSSSESFSEAASSSSSSAARPEFIPTPFSSRATALPQLSEKEKPLTIEEFDAITVKTQEVNAKIEEIENMSLPMILPIGDRVMVLKRLDKLNILTSEQNKILRSIKRQLEALKVTQFELNNTPLQSESSRATANSIRAINAMIDQLEALSASANLGLRFGLK